jgi:hypothetical protein
VLGAAGTLDTDQQSGFAIPASQPLTFGIDPAAAGTSGKIVADGLDITNAAVTLTLAATLDGAAYVLATYNSLTGATFASVAGVPSGYELDYDFEDNKIALVSTGASPYGSFVSDNGLQDPWLGIDPALNGEPDADPDNDGFPNAVEFVLGEDPTSGTVVNPPTAASVGTNLVFTFRLTDEAASYDPDIWVVEYDADLAPAWSVISPGDPEVSVGGNLGGYRLVTVTIPKNGNTNLFARLRVTIP